jgi:hypothetical protein
VQKSNQEIFGIWLMGNIIMKRTKIAYLPALSDPDPFSLAHSQTLIVVATYPSSVACSAYVSPFTLVLAS